jgi:hypothetical protein
MRRRLLVLLGLLSLFLPVLTAAPATANTYPGLHQQDWTHGDLVLRARIAIEVNDFQQGRFRFRMQCFASGASTPCDLFPGVAHWYDLTDGAHYVNSTLAACAVCYEDVWTGSYRPLLDNHTYAVKEVDFQAYFRGYNYWGSFHTICSYRVTWHTSADPTIGSLYCSYP